jgi:hypothetical protein
MDWDFVITGLVIVLIVLIVWARVSHQTIKDVILDIKDMLSGGKEEIEEKVEGVTIYE